MDSGSPYPIDPAYMVSGASIVSYLRWGTGPILPSLNQPDLLFFFAVLGFELRVYILSHFTSPFFVIGIFEIESCELFVQAGFELQPS
jgi:hypothetical protein